jgi:hypothetical protein
MAKKFQIFVSSTFKDLTNERQDTIRSILDLGHIPAGMELFPAADTEQLVYIKKVIDECDYYVLIIGGRYGSLDAEGVSFTEREYDYAVATGKIVLAFVHGNASTLPLQRNDTAPKLVKGLNEFREKVMSGRLVRQWTSRENLEALVIKAIAKAVNDTPAVGWIRGDAAASEDMLSEINMLRIENQKLKKDIYDLKRQNFPQIEGLAQLDSSVTLRYNYKVFSGGGSLNQIGSVATTWASLFKAIGPALLEPGVRDRIKDALRIFAMEELEVRRYYQSFFEADVVMIENQFVALGYLRSYNAESKAGVINNFLSLSDAGRKKLAELLAVRG